MNTQFIGATESHFRSYFKFVVMKKKGKVHIEITDVFLQLTILSGSLERESRLIPITVNKFQIMRY